MSNPWLTIDADSYVGHMKLVGQSAVLRRVFLDAYNRLRPRSLLVLGCSTGEDLLEVDFTQTARVVGLDVNPDYVALARIATAGLPTEFVCQDVLSTTHSFGRFDLVYAALLAEYVDVRRLLTRMAQWTNPLGVSVLVSQDPSSARPAISTSPYSALQALEGFMQLHSADKLEEDARAVGLVREGLARVESAEGKTFSVSRFRHGDSSRRAP